MFKYIQKSLPLIVSLLISFPVSAQDNPVVVSDVPASEVKLENSYAVMVKVPGELFTPINSIQQYILGRLSAINKEIETANKFNTEQVSLLVNPEVLKPDGLHMTLQMIADARKISLTGTQLKQIKEILHSIASSLSPFDLVNDVGNLQFTLMGNFLAIEFIPAPEKLEKLVAEIKKKLGESGITFGPIYPTFKAHISLFKSKDPLVKVAIRSLADGWSGDVKDKYQSLAPTRIASFPIDEFLLTTMDDQRKIIPVEEFKLGTDADKTANQTLGQQQVQEDIKTAMSVTERDAIQESIKSLKGQLQKIDQMEFFLKTNKLPRLETNRQKLQIEQALKELEARLSN